MFLDIEDQDNWHGKPIPKDKLDGILNDLQSQIQVPNKILCPGLPNDDAAPADLSLISLPSPPAYKMGDKVPPIYFLFIYLFLVQGLLGA